MFKTRQPYLEEDSGVNLGGGGEPTNEPVSEPVNEPTSTPEGVNTEPQKIKVKYNHQEIELPYEEAITHIQKGMNYEKGVERAKQEARQEARDNYISEQGFVDIHGRPITTESQYNQALKEKEMYDKLASQGLPDEVIQEIALSRQEREERRRKDAEQAEMQKKAKENMDFLEFFKQKNGRYFDTEKDTIPQEVITLNKQGKTLADAYAHYLNQQYEAKLADYEARIKAEETNEKNASSTTGSVTGNGTSVDTITEASINAHSEDVGWMKKNYNKVLEFYTKKKG